MKAGEPDPLSVERAVAHIYTDLGRWFYDSAAPDRAAAVAFYRDHLGVGSDRAGKRVLERWEADDRPTLRRDAVWVLCGREKPDADPGTARYLDPIEFVSWRSPTPTRTGRPRRSSVGRTATCTPATFSSGCVAARPSTRPCSTTG